MLLKHVDGSLYPFCYLVRILRKQVSLAVCVCTHLAQVHCGYFKKSYSVQIFHNDAQVLPSVNGKLIDCTWPSMAGSLVSSQLSSLAAREEDMVASLTAACHEVRQENQGQKGSMHMKLVFRK